jgi:hypothetical protein
MRSTFTSPIRTAVYYSTLSLLAASSSAFAQDPPPVQPSTEAPSSQRQNPASTGVWLRFDAPPAKQRNSSVDSRYLQVQNDNQNQGSQNEGIDQDQSERQSNSQSDSAVPAKLTLKAGKFVTVSVNQFLSSDRNQPGDPFSATLAHPLVVDGFLIAQRGQTVAGRVAEAQKAGRVQGVSRLALELTDLTLVDGQQVSIESQLLGRSGPTSVGRDVTAVAGTTALGAAIGGSARGGVGAAIGAGAGAVVGTVGVLLTRGRATVVYPEALLTFRIAAPVIISTERAPQAFRYMDPSDYERPPESQRQPPSPRGACSEYGCPPPPYYYSRYYGYYGPAYYPYYPYYYGPGFSFFYGPRFSYGRGRFRGFRR